MLNRAAKKLINATDDSSIIGGDDFYQAFNETESISEKNIVAEQVAVEIEQNANSVPFEPAAIEQKQEPKTVADVTAGVKQQEKVAEDRKSAAAGKDSSKAPKQAAEVPESEELPDFA